MWVLGFARVLREECHGENVFMYVYLCVYDMPIILKRAAERERDSERESERTLEKG